MILVLDNYDSFTYNLVQVFGALGAEVRVVRNDQGTLEELSGPSFTHVVVSPGPGRPEDAGLSIPLIQRCHGQRPLLGVCLGHQAIAAALGSPIVRAERLMHGKACPVHHDGSALFRGLSNPFVAGRYHSLLVPRDTLPSALRVLAWSEDEEIMALQWEDQPTFGVQFHPESVLTPEGVGLLRNFLEMR